MGKLPIVVSIFFSIFPIFTPILGNEYLGISGVEGEGFRDRMLGEWLRVYCSWH